MAKYAFPAIFTKEDVAGCYTSEVSELAEIECDSDSFVTMVSCDTMEYRSNIRQ